MTDNQYIDRCSQSSSVTSWLETLPSTWNHGNRFTTLSPKRKRERLEHFETRSQPETRRKSRRLAEMSNNVQRRSPRKLLTPNELLQLKAPSSAQNLQSAGDLDTTPKPSRSSHLGSNALGCPTYPPSNPPSESQSSHSHTSSIASSRLSQPRSPTEHLSDTLFSNFPMSRVALTPDAVPGDVQELVRYLKRSSKGVGIIPGSVQKEMLELGEEVDEYEIENVPEDCCSAQGTLSHKSFLARAHSIWENAMDCVERGASEATWNEEVHCQILNLALRGHWKGKDVWYQNITTARITDKSLLPTIGKATVESKLVDYAIIINSPDRFRDRLVAKLSSLPPSGRVALSINATSAEYILLYPIAVSIETKRKDGPQDTTDIQLGTWVIAHFLKLRQLMQNPSADLPTLPLLSVVGHDWKLMLAYMTPDQRLKVLDNLFLGDTRRLGGVYRIVAAIRRLATWVDEQYRPWFEKEVLADLAQLPKQ